MTLSVIVYGRNDNHGYNMHKRIAISLNCIAEVLTHQDDEILYVDYNTSNDLPCVIEAIHDTLTDKAKKLLRVFRVRPEIHDRFKTLTHAQVNEPLARNIAIRRSNPKNKWILSTNTDMVFTILDASRSLSDIVSNLEDGFYELARFEVPEPLWEALDRKNPVEIINKFKHWGKSLHLNEVVYGNDIIIYDAPGDFQLMLRDDIFAIDGFDENMIYGWHVDSNLCKRMWLLRKKINILQDKLYGYHCNQTRVSGWMHSTRRKKENNIEIFFDKITKAELPEQKDNWGLPLEEVEEIRIGHDRTSNFITQLEKVITSPLTKEFTESFYNEKGYSEIFYSTYHIIPYLFEQILLLKNNANIVYLGYNQLLFDKLQEFSSINNKINIYYYQDFPSYAKNNKNYRQYELMPKTAIPIELNQINEKADMLIFDFGLENKDLHKRYELEILYNIFNYQELILKIIANEASAKPIKVINIGTHNTSHYKSVKKFFNVIQNPYNTHILVGYKVNTFLNLREKFYVEYFKEKVFNLINKENFLKFFLVIPFYSLVLSLSGFALYKLKLLSLKHRLNKNRKIFNQHSSRI